MYTAFETKAPSSQIVILVTCGMFHDFRCYQQQIVSVTAMDF
jgi:hypothetical protein